MRTTLDVDEDILMAIKSLAQRENKSMGQVISELARKSLQPSKISKYRNGVPLLPVNKNRKPVTLELVNQIRDGEEI